MFYKYCTILNDPENRNRLHFNNPLNFHSFTEFFQVRFNDLRLTIAISVLSLARIGVLYYMKVYIDF